MKRILILALLLLLHLSCTSGGNALERCLTPEELDFARRVVQESYARIYNQVAQEGTTEAPDVLERYFDNGLRLGSSLGVMDPLIPDTGFTKVLLRLFDDDVTGRFLEYDPDTHRCAIRKDGKYMEVLSRMSRRNGFFKGFYKFMQESDGCSGVPYIISINYRNIDFEREDEQFIAYLALLTRPGEGTVRFEK